MYETSAVCGPGPGYGCSGDGLNHTSGDALESMASVKRPTPFLGQTPINIFQKQNLVGIGWS